MRITGIDLRRQSLPGSISAFGEPNRVLRASPRPLAIPDDRRQLRRQSAGAVGVAALDRCGADGEGGGGARDGDQGQWIELGRPAS